MQLILWRHAEAAPGNPDEARPLTDTGRLHAKQMAQWLQPRLPPGLLILFSPAIRARQTADATALPPGEAFAGVTRVRLATEGAVKNNIAGAISKLAALSL